MCIAMEHHQLMLSQGMNLCLGESDEVEALQAIRVKPCRLMLGIVCYTWRGSAERWVGSLAKASCLDVSRMLSKSANVCMPEQTAKASFFSMHLLICIYSWSLCLCM